MRSLEEIDDEWHDVFMEWLRGEIGDSEMEVRRISLRAEARLRTAILDEDKTQEIEMLKLSLKMVRFDVFVLLTVLVCGIFAAGTAFNSLPLWVYVVWGVFSIAFPLWYWTDIKRWD